MTLGSDDEFDYDEFDEYDWSAEDWYLNGNY